jgi:hypothetical protein
MVQMAQQGQLMSPRSLEEFLTCINTELRSDTGITAPRDVSAMEGSAARSP